MKDAAQYPITDPYGDTSYPYGTAANPYHRGDDRYMPVGTPILVNGVLIGYSGQTGWVTGPHLHVGRFISSKDTNPKGEGFTLNNPQVTDIGYDDTNGNYVGLKDADGVRWVYLHMRERSTAVKVGDFLDKLPKFEEGDNDMPALNEGDIKNIADTFDIPVDAVQNAKNWNDVFYNVIKPRIEELLATDAQKKLAQIKELLQ